MLRAATPRSDHPELHVRKDPSHTFVSRGGLKLRHALDAFNLDVAALRCADLGASTGGFTDCLLQAGAAHVVSVDTAYGQFAWKLRNDPRVTLLERSNALHTDPVEQVDLVVMDLGWTPQRLAVPAALRWLKPSGRLVTLLKPHYELDASEKHLLHAGVLAEADAEAVCARVAAALPALGVSVVATTPSPIEGSKEKGRGNREWLALVTPTLPGA
jgi:23S rRNA (cytidine1920-2'-O)/16S rRNA (cytidine1409-2'-O)-methyltransferase